jgi:hypothetical protein
MSVTRWGTCWGMIVGATDDTIKVHPTQHAAYDWIRREAERLAAGAEELPWIAVYSCDETGRWFLHEVIDLRAMADAINADEADAERLAVGTVLRPGDSEPPDGTVLLHPGGVWERYQSSEIGGRWPQFATAMGPFVVAPDYDDLVGNG